MKKEKDFNPHMDRYFFDTKLCDTATGWAQIDTDEDAPYFGKWAHPFLLEIVEYTEGDIVRWMCESEDEFRICIKQLHDFQIGRQGGRFVIDTMGNNRTHDRFKQLGLGALIH